MTTDLWNRDPGKWLSLPLIERIRLLRNFHCTGPCGQSSAVLGNRQALSSTLLECALALDTLQELYDCQNGPPLETPRIKKEWEEAMSKARTVLGI